MLIRFTTENGSTPDEIRSFVIGFTTENDSKPDETRNFLIGFTTENDSKPDETRHFPIGFTTENDNKPDEIRNFLIGFTTGNGNQFCMIFEYRPLPLGTKNDANTDVILHFGSHLRMPHTDISRPMGKRNV